MSDMQPTTPGTPLDPLDTGHDYDGIREHDNRLPNWWLATLFLAIIFGFGYWIYYHTLQVGLSPRQEYAAELQQAAEQAESLARARGAMTGEVLQAMASNPAVIAAGAATFKTSCAVCHGAQGQGIIGPNLTDDYWIHGGQPLDLLKVVKGGVPDKGMPAWGPVLGDETVEHVVAYVLTLRGTHVTGKPPQGALVTAANTHPPANPIAP